MPGPLAGMRVVEMVGLGPGPFCAMMLADMGAEVIRIDRPGRKGLMPDRYDLLARGRRSVALDLKRPQAVEAVLALVQRADVLVEGFRPGVMERLGLGPQPCLQRQPSLVYGRMTGWGQSGPLAQVAGHDINYIALSGALWSIGRAGESPPPPLNLVGDFGGGAMLLAFGILAAVYEVQRSGQGQVVDAAMTDGSALLTTMMHGMRAGGLWSGQRQANFIDGGAHYYGTYACADGKFIAIGAIEPQFYACLRELCGLQAPAFDAQNNPRQWPELRQRLAQLFATRTRDQWCELLEGHEACFAPVLDWDEAPAHPHNRARSTFVEVDGVVQPAPAPRFSRTPAGVPGAPRAVGQDTRAVLRDWGLAESAVDAALGSAQGEPT